MKFENKCCAIVAGNFWLKIHESNFSCAIVLATFQEIFSSFIWIKFGELSVAQVKISQFMQGSIVFFLQRRPALPVLKDSLHVATSCVSTPRCSVMETMTAVTTATKIPVSSVLV